MALTNYPFPRPLQFCSVGSPVPNTYKTPITCLESKDPTLRDDLDEAVLYAEGTNKIRDVIYPEEIHNLVDVFMKYDEPLYPIPVGASIFYFVMIAWMTTFYFTYLGRKMLSNVKEKLDLHPDANRFPNLPLYWLQQTKREAELRREVRNTWAWLARRYLLSPNDPLLANVDQVLGLVNWQDFEVTRGTWSLIKCVLRVNALFVRVRKMRNEKTIDIVRDTDLRQIPMEGDKVRRVFEEIIPFSMTYVKTDAKMQKPGKITKASISSSAAASNLELDESDVLSVSKPESKMKTPTSTAGTVAPPTRGQSIAHTVISHRIVKPPASKTGMKSKKLDEEKRTKGKSAIAPTSESTTNKKQPKGDGKMKSGIPGHKLKSSKPGAKGTKTGTGTSVRKASASSSASTVDSAAGVPDSKIKAAGGEPSSDEGEEEISESGAPISATVTSTRRGKQEPKDQDRGRRGPGKRDKIGDRMRRDMKGKPDKTKDESVASSEEDLPGKLDRTRAGQKPSAGSVRKKPGREDEEESEEGIRKGRAPYSKGKQAPAKAGDKIRTQVATSQDKDGKGKPGKGKDHYIASSEDNLRKNQGARDRGGIKPSASAKEIRKKSDSDEEDEEEADEDEDEVTKENAPTTAQRLKDGKQLSKEGAKDRGVPGRSGITPPSKGKDQKATTQKEQTTKPGRSKGNSLASSVDDLPLKKDRTQAGQKPTVQDREKDLKGKPGTGRALDTSGPGLKDDPRKKERPGTTSKLKPSAGAGTLRRKLGEEDEEEDEDEEEMGGVQMTSGPKRGKEVSKGDKQQRVPGQGQLKEKIVTKSGRTQDESRASSEEDEDMPKKQGPRTGAPSRLKGTGARTKDDAAQPKEKDTRKTGRTQAESRASSEEDEDEDTPKKQGLRIGAPPRLKGTGKRTKDDVGDNDEDDDTPKKQGLRTGAPSRLKGTEARTKDDVGGQLKQKDTKKPGRTQGESRASSEEDEDDVTPKKQGLRVVAPPRLKGTAARTKDEVGDVEDDGDWEEVDTEDETPGTSAAAGKKQGKQVTKDGARTLEVPGDTSQRKDKEHKKLRDQRSYQSVASSADEPPPPKPHLRVVAPPKLKAPAGAVLRKLHIETDEEEDAHEHDARKSHNISAAESRASRLSSHIQAHTHPPFTKYNLKKGKPNKRKGEKEMMTHTITKNEEHKPFDLEMYMNMRHHHF